jgi:hypothetical protein
MSETTTALAAEPTTPQAAPVAPAPAPAAPAAAAPASAEPSLLDLAEAPPPDAAAPAGRPDYLPEAFWDAEKGAPRIESLAKSWTDLRNKLAKGGHTAPESPDAYRLPAIEGLPADIVPSDDPLWGAVRNAAHQAGLTPAQLEAVAKPYLEAAAKQKADAAQANDPEAVRAAFDREVARLGPQGRQVLADVRSWIDGLTARGVLTADERREMVSGIWNADQVRALAKLRSLSGEKPIPVTALDDGSMTVADAKRMLHEGLAAKDEGMAEKARRALRDMEARGLLKAS